MLYDPIWDKRHEECGVLGIYDKDLDISRYVYWGLFALQHRGQESGGMALSDGEESRPSVVWDWSVRFSRTVFLT